MQWIDILKSVGGIGGAVIGIVNYLRSASRDDVAKLKTEVRAIRAYVGLLHTRLNTFLDVLDELIFGLNPDQRAPFRTAVDGFRTELLALKKEHGGLHHDDA